MFQSWLHIGAECCEFSVISSSRNEEISSGIDEMEAEVDAGSNAEGKAGLQDFLYALQKFRKDCENFATIAKISQSLRKFRYGQFFAMLAKFRYHGENSLSWQKFAIIAKVTVHSENFNFRYALYFRYDSKISLS